MTETLRGIEKLTMGNVTAYLRVQHLVGLRWKWEAIADDLGLVGENRVKELCDWVLRFKEPRIALVANKSYVREIPASRKSSNDAARFINWRKQHEGARMAREELEMDAWK